MSSLAQLSPTPPFAAVLFFAFAGLTCLSACMIVLSQNIVRMSVYLLLTLGGAAGLYFMLEAEFLAAVQLIVYAGGTLILIIFGVMLTSKNPFLQLKASNWELAAGVAIALLIAVLLLVAVLGSSPLVRTAPVVPEFDRQQVEMIGKGLLSKYLVPFEMAAVLLLVVMIGAAYMARRRAKGG